MTEKIDVHHTAAKYAVALRRLDTNQEISEANTAHIRAFLHACQLGKTVLGREKKRIREKRLLKYLSTLRNLSHWFEHTDFATISQAQMEAFITRLEANQLTLKRDGQAKPVRYAAWTQRDIKVCLKKFYKWLLGDNQAYPPGQPYAAFGLREDEWLKHVLIVGMTGTGKTTLAVHLLRQLRQHKKPFLVFDWKQSYRAVRQLTDLADTRVFTVARKTAPFRFNPLVPPPGTPPGEWLMQLVDVLKHAYFVGEGVEYLLRRGIDWCYQHCGVFDAQPRATPTFLRVRDFVQKQRVQGRMSLWKASALRVLEALCFRHGLGPVTNTGPTVDMETLLTQPVVLELDALADADKVFLTEALILWLYHYRTRHGEREVFHHALLIEEGHHILSQQKERSTGAETIMETCLRQIREFGEAVIVIDQEPSKLSDSIKANTYTKIAFTLGNGADIDDITRCMRLTPDEANTLKLLDIGEAIVTLNGRTHRPLHVRFPALPIKKE